MAKETKEAAPVTKAKRELAILLEEMEIPFTGMRVTKTTTHLVTAGLIWPRTGIALKNGSLSAKLERGTASFGNENWGRKIILRENVEGRFALSLTLTEALNYEKLEKFLRECLRIAIKAGGDIADSLTGPAGDFVSAPFDAAAKMIGTYPGPKLLAQGMAELDAADFPESGGERPPYRAALCVAEFLRCRAPDAARQDEQCKTVEVARRRFQREHHASRALPLTGEVAEWAIRDLGS